MHVVHDCTLILARHVHAFTQQYNKNRQERQQFIDVAVFVKCNIQVHDIKFNKVTKRQSIHKYNTL